MNKTKHLNWGFLSTANINRKLLQPLSMSPRNHLLAVASRDLEKARAYALDKGISRFYGSYDELLEDPEIDVIYNPLPNHLHKEWTVKALRAGKHVLCEKPFVLTLDEMDEVISVVRETGLVAAEAFMYRTHALTHRVQNIVKSGELGEVRMIKGSFTYFSNDDANIRWYPEMGGGALWDVGCYPVSYARTILEMEPVEAYAMQKNSPRGVDATMMGLLRFHGEIFMQFECSFEAVYRTEMEIIGSKATLRIPRPFTPGPYATIYRSDHSSNPQAIEVRGNELYVDEIEDMADAVLHGKPPTVSLEDSKANTRALLALLKSAATNRPVACAKIT